MKWSVVGLIVVGLVAAVAAAVLVAAVRHEGGISGLLHPGLASAEVRVICASRDLAAPTVIDKSMIETRALPRKEAPEQFISNEVQAIGKVLRLALKEGQPLARSHLAPDKPLDQVLERGQRAVSVSMNDFAGLYGVLYPGCLVDVMVSFKTGGGTAGGRQQPFSITFLRRVEVLAVDDQSVVDESGDDDADSKAGKKSTSASASNRTRRLRVTLRVDPPQAEAIQVAMQIGTLALALRNPQDKTDQEKDKQFTTLTDFFGEYLERLKVPVAPKTPLRLESPPPELSDGVGKWTVDVYRAGKLDEKVTVDLPQPKDASAMRRPQ